MYTSEFFKLEISELYCEIFSMSGSFPGPLDLSKITHKGQIKLFFLECRKFDWQSLNACIG